MFEVLAFERNDALITGGVAALIDCHCEMAFAEQRPRIGRVAGDGGGDPSSVEPGTGAHLVRCGVVDHQHPHWPVALRLQNEAALELQGRSEQHGEHDRFAQQLRHRRGILVVRKNRVDCRSEANDAPAQIERFDLKRQDGVIHRPRRGRSRRNLHARFEHDDHI